MFDTSTGSGNEKLPVHTVEVATNETVESVQAHLSQKALRILEVGCGRGEVALRLQENGHYLIAIDSDAGVVEQASRLRIDAHLARWPNFEEVEG